MPLLKDASPFKGKSHERLRWLAFGAAASRKVRQADVVDDEDAAVINNTGKTHQASVLRAAEFPRRVSSDRRLGYVP